MTTLSGGRTTFIESERDIPLVREVTAIVLLLHNLMTYSTFTPEKRAKKKLEKEEESLKAAKKALGEAIESFRHEIAAGYVADWCRVG